MKAPVDRSSGVLLVKCPICGSINAFPNIRELDGFTCEDCQQAVEVIETVQ